jgi:archaellum biogenesis protein FlaJ (TadC family)
VRAVGFMRLDELSRIDIITTFRIILATELHFLNDILQTPAPGLHEILSAYWALIHFLSAAVAYVVTILTHRNGWHHVLLTYRTLEFFQNLPSGDAHLSAAGSTHANL